MEKSDGIIGKAIQLHGQVHLHSRNGNDRVMEQGDPIHAGDIIVTAAGADLQLLLPDGSIYTIGQSETVVLNGDFAPTMAGPADDTQPAVPEEDSTHHFVRLAQVGESIPETLASTAGLADSLHYSAFADDFTATGGLQSIVNTLDAKSSGSSPVGYTDDPGSTGSSGTSASGSGSGSSGEPGNTGPEPGSGQDSGSGAGGSSGSNPIVVTPIPGITINPIAALTGADADSSANIVISGTVSRSVPAGNVVTVTVDGHHYTGTVEADGSYSVAVPLAVLADAAVDTVYASVHLGGPGSPVIESSLGYEVLSAGGTGASTVGVDIDPLPVINAGDAASATPIAVTGTVNAPAGVSVTVTADGHTYSGTVGANGAFSVGVPGNILAGASVDTLQVSVSGTDATGHAYNGSATLTYTVDVALPVVSITINPIASIGASEAASSAPVAITGTVSSNVPVGDVVTVTVNGHSYTGTVVAGGSYSVEVPGNVLGAEPTGSLRASVSVTDAAGNVGTATAGQAYSVATSAEFGIEINPIATINGAEAASSAPVMITGTVSGTHPAGDLVMLTVGGQSYTGVVQANGSYSIGVPGEVMATAANHNVNVVSVSITDSNGHAATASASQSYDVELVAPPIAVSVNALAPLTSAEAQSATPIVISGTVSANVALGTSVSATVDGHTYSGTVQAGDVFSVSIPGNVLGSASSGNIQVSVSAVDAAGNTASASVDLPYAVAPVPPAISISVDPIGAITGAEVASGATITVSGSVTGNVPTGSTVTATVDGSSFTGSVASDGTFHVNVPAGAMALGAQGGLHLSVSATGAGGAVGTASTTMDYSVDTGTNAAVTVNPLPVINGATAASANPVTISGEVGSNVPVGTVITVGVDGQSYTGTVQTGGDYSVNVPGNVLGAAGAGTDSIQISVPATSSSTATTVTQSYTVELSAPPVTIAISPIAAISATEAASSAPVVIQGTVSSDVPVGTAVTLTVDGNTYLGTVQAGGSYSIGVPGTVLAAGPTDSVHVSMSTTDAAGNSASAAADLAYTVAPAAASIDMTVAPIPTVNGAEAASSAPIDISGTVSASVPVAGDTVSVTIGSTTYTGTVQANGSYSVPVPGDALATAGSVQVVVTATEANGQVSSSSITEPVTVELAAPPIGISVDPIATVNGAEAAGSTAVAITGSVSSNVPAGTTVTLTVSGESYTGTTQANGSFSVGVPGNVLANAATDSVQASVSTVDAAGNTASASDSQSYSVELNAPAIGISINAIAAVNGAEAASNAAIAVTGSVSGNVPAGATVTLSVDGQNYTGTVQADGSYSIGVPGNVLAAAATDSVHASISSTDAAGNTATASADLAYTVELSAAAIGIGIDQIAPITLAEAASTAPVAITGTVSSNVNAGDTVTLAVGGNTYSGTVTANHTYSVGVPGNVLAGAANDTVQASVSNTDAAGNTASASASASYSVYNSSIVVDVTLEPLPTINAAMAAGSVTVSGTVNSSVPAGDSVSLAVDGHTYTGTVQAGGTFSVGIPGSVLAGAASDSISASVSVTESNGQVVSGTSSLAYSVELAAPPISIAINQLGTVNALDALSSNPIDVTGSVSNNVPAGTLVSLSVSGQTYTGAVHADGSYSIGVPGNVLALASNDTINASVSTTDAAGNTASASATEAYTVELVAAAISVSLDPIAVINASAAASASLIAVTGSVSADVPVGDTVTLTVGGQTYSGLVQAGDTFSIGVPGNVLGAAASVHAGVSTTDAAGNTASAGITEAYTVELAAPPITVVVDSIPTINATVAASANPVDVTGSVSANVPVGTSVSATVDGQVYSGTVLANGTYNIAVPGDVLAGATNDTVTVGLSVTDAAGNVASASQTLAYAVELAAPPISVSINSIATINAAVAASGNPVAITGSVSSNVPAGDIVTVAVGGENYTGTVSAGGSFSVGVPGSVLAAASNDSVTVSLSATDAAGNVANASSTLTYSVELTAPPLGIGINAIATINAAEAASANPIAITGTVSSNVPVGDIVTLTVGGNTYSGAVSAGDTYSIGVPGNVLANAAGTTVQVSVSATDAVGNVATGSASETYSVNTAAPTLNIAIDPIITINGAIAASSSLIAITGTVSANVPIGDVVTLVAGGQSYTGTVTAGGTFSVGVPGNVLAAAATDSVTASVSASDSSGNVGTASATLAYNVELTAPPINIGINPIATINGITGASASPIAVSGTVSADVPAGSIVTLSVGGSSYTGAVTALGTYSIGIPGNVLAAASSDSIQASISTTDAAGNTASASASLSYSVELSGAPVSISINPIATINGIVGASAGLVDIAGSVSANVPVGDIVTLSVAGNSYTGVVGAGGTYSIGIPGNVLAGAAVDSISASVSVTDGAGNVSSASAALAYGVELAASSISVAINPIVTINGAMAASSAPVLITGTVSANVPVGTPVSLSVAGNVYAGLVLAGGIYSIGVPGNVLAGATSDNVQVSISTTDAAGNVASASASLGYTVELVAPLISISINPIGLLSSLLTGNVSIGGSVSSNVPVGTLLTVNVGGGTYTGVVQPGGTYSVGVPALVLLASILDIVQVAISFTDPAGNVASASASQGYTVGVSGSVETAPHNAQPLMMHFGQENRHVESDVLPHRGHALNTLLGDDKLAFSLAPHVQTASKPGSFAMETRSSALQLSDLLVDHHPAHHTGPRLPAPHEPLHAAALHAVFSAMPHALPIIHESLSAHMQWQRSAAIE